MIEKEKLTKFVRMHHSVLNMAFVYKIVNSRLGIQIRNMKMVFNIFGTWCRVMFEKLMMKIYDFFLFG